MNLQQIKIIRPLNLLILAATQYFINIFLLIPNFSNYGIYFSLDAFHFFLLVFSTVLICAGGNIINDYYDVKIDEINKPQKQFVGKVISKRSAIVAYWVLTITGLLIGIYVAYKAGNIKLATMHGVCILLLYFYSYSYKKIILLGNFIVALLIALSILIIGVFEPHLYNLQREGDYYIAGLCWRYLIGLSVFAFLLTLIREIIKDTEDMEGDHHGYVNSVPIVWGLKTAKGIVCAIVLGLLILCAYILFYGELKSEIIYLNYGIILMIELLYFFYMVIRAKEKKDFTFLSMLAKVIMLTGILFLPVYYFVNF